MKHEQGVLSGFHYLKKISYSVRLYIGIILLIGSILLVMFHFFSEAFYEDLILKREKRLMNVAAEISNDVRRAYEENGNFKSDTINRSLLRYQDNSLDCFEGLTIGYYDLNNNFMLSVGTVEKSENVKDKNYNLEQFTGSSNRIYRETALFGMPDTKGSISVVPVHYQNKVIGYVWSQSETSDIAIRTAEVNKRLLKIVYVVFAVGLMGAYVINHYSRKSLLQFAKDVNLLEEKTLDYYIEIPELNPLLEEIIKTRQNRLYQAVINERMSTIAQLSAGLAHDIRNPLTSIKGFLQILENRVHNNDQELIKISLDELDSINGLIHDMLYLVDPPASNFQVSDIIKVTENVIDYLNSEAKEKKIQLTMKTISEIPLILFDVEQIKIVLINVLRNSFESIHGSNGCVEIMINRCHQKNNIIITVVDNGKGFSQQLKEKIFDPLFTTKNNGSGLGLPICKEIIHKHKGILNIKSIPDVGTTVSIQLPI